MTIDIRTLVIVLGLTYVAQILALSLQAWTNRRYRGIGWWLLWSASAAAGFAFMLLRTIPAIERIAIVSQNALVVFAAICLYVGIMRFLDRRETRGAIASGYAAYVAALVYFVYARDDIVIRAVLTSLTLAAIACLSALSLVTGKSRARRGAVYFCSAVFLAHMLVCLHRAAMVLAGADVTDVFGTTLFNAFVYLDGILASLLWTFGLIIMVNQRASAETSEARDRFRLLFDASPDAVLITRMADGVCREVNEGFLALSGFSRSEVIGQSSLALGMYWSAADRQRVVGELQRAGFCDNVELPFRRKDGSRLTGIMSARLLPLDGMSHVISVIRDITGRERSEAALRESNLRLTMALESARIGIHEWDLVTNQLIWDDRVCELWGVTPGRSVSYELLMQGVHPDDRARVRAAIDRVLAVEGDGRYLDEYRVVGIESGVERWVELHGQMFWDGGRPVRFIGTAMDVSARKVAGEEAKSANARWAGMAGSNAVGVVLADAQGGLLEVNDYYLDLLGVTRGEYEDGGVRWDERTPPEHLPADWRAIAELRERGICTPYEKEYLRKDGSRVWVLIADALLPGPDERILAVVVDVTKRKRAEEEARRLLSEVEQSRRVLLSVVEDQRGAEAQVRQLNIELEQRVRDRTLELEAANRELEAFSYSVSHDLRAPLRAINGYASILTEDHGTRLDAEGQRVLEVVRREAVRMGRLIDDLLRFSRLGRQPLQKALTDMTALVREVQAELSGRTPGRSPDFRLGSLPAVPADPALVRQVWLNLLDNAWKYTRHREHAEVVVSGWIDGGDAVYCVKDNGTGFEMKYAEKLFGVFQRLHRAEEFEGTGVGLALVQRILHRHGGRIWAQAEPDRGATFRFTLPTATESSVTAAAASGDEPARDVPTPGA